MTPGAYIFQRPFLRGLFLEGLRCTEKNLCFKINGLACSGEEIYHFCCVLLCIRGQIPSTSPPGVLILIWSVTIGGGGVGAYNYLEGLVHGVRILRYIIN